MAITLGSLFDGIGVFPLAPPTMALFLYGRVRLKKFLFLSQRNTSLKCAFGGYYKT